MDRTLNVFADAIEKLAFEMPAPNPYTPRFVQLAIEARSVATYQAQLTEGAPPAADVLKYTMILKFDGFERVYEGEFAAHSPQGDKNVD